MKVDNRVYRIVSVMHLICFWLVSTLAWAEQELVIEITSSQVAATKIAIAPFYWQGKGVLPEDVASIVSSDLDRSGRFKSMARDQMLSRPYKREDVFYEEWRSIGQEYLVIGDIITEQTGNYKLTYYLLDVFNGEVIDALEVRTPDLRDLAHYVADKIYEKLTGVPGAFSTQILYVTVERFAGGVSTYRLQKADADGYRARTILESAEPVLSPTWSPDAKRVAYVSFKGGRPAIYSQELATGRQTKLASFKGINGAPDWSPDGRFMVMALSKDGNPEIYQLELATKRWTRLTNHYAIDTEPRWAPDGKSIIFTSNRGGSVQIYEMRLADRRIKRLTYEGGYNARGDISNDGRHLIMVHRKRGNFHIAVQDIATGVVNVLTETLLDESPSIAPNGSMLIYATLDGGQGILSAVSIDGQVKFRIPSRRGEVREPVWSPML